MMAQENSFFFFRTFWGALRHADWDGAAERGPLALVVEFFRALLGLSAWPFFIPVDSEWRPAAIRQILGAHGIVHWGWGRQGDEFFFQVRLRQAIWTQYLLQQHGVPLSGQLLDESKRSAYRPGPRRSLRPAPGASPTVRNGQMVSPAQTPTRESSPAPLRDPVGQINQVVDRLAKW
jgi:hypothetical protein